LRTLMSERFAPITSSIGFLEAGLEEVVAAVAAWRRTLYPAVTVSRRRDGFPDALMQLEPLTGGARPRELFVAAGRWTAYFDNSLQGTDAVSVVPYLSRQLECQGMAIDVVPHTFGSTGIHEGRMGAVQFELFGPLDTDFLNYVRTVSVAFDGGKWRFTATGTPQAFEEIDAYKARRTRDRFIQPCWSAIARHWA
jgi:hypothetical protein